MELNTQAELIIFGDVRILLKDVAMYIPEYELNTLTIFIKGITDRANFKYEDKDQLDKVVKVLDTVLSGRCIAAGTECVKNPICVDGVFMSQSNYVATKLNL